MSRHVLNVIYGEKVFEMEPSDLEKVRNAILVADERSRHQQCKCDWDYATEHGTQRAHNPLCPVHDLELATALPESTPVRGR